MAAKAEEYRSKARECRRQGELARDPAAKQAYEDLARQWDELGGAGRASRKGPRALMATRVALGILFLKCSSPMCMVPSSARRGRRWSG
jgi:hypothetical protein